MEEGRGTDPRILMLIYAVLNYFEALKEPVNPFVKGFAVSEKVEEANNFLLSCLQECSDYFPEVDEMVDVLSETTNKEESQTQDD